jgi:ferredoxin
MNMHPLWLQSIIDELALIGLNIVGFTDGSKYCEFLDGCRSAVVFANGGTDLWDSFIEDLKRRPEHLSRHQHPFDDFVHRAIHKADPEPTPTRRWIRCAAEPEVFLDFRPLAHEAGIGFQSKMGLIIHPEYGLWVGLRAVLLTTEDLLPKPTSMKDSPCASCEFKPCISACPAGAVGPSGWSVKICAQHHQESTDCHGRCHSRNACPVGVEHRHGLLQHNYHNAREDGRVKLAKNLGIIDKITGLNPKWADWS